MDFSQIPEITGPLQTSDQILMSRDGQLVRRSALTGFIDMVVGAIGPALANGYRTQFFSTSGTAGPFVLDAAANGNFWLVALDNFLLRPDVDFSYDSETRGITLVGLTFDQYSRLMVAHSYTPES